MLMLKLSKFVQYLKRLSQTTWTDGCYYVINLESQSIRIRQPMLVLFGFARCRLEITLSDLERKLPCDARAVSTDRCPRCRATASKSRVSEYIRVPLECLSACTAWYFTPVRTHKRFNAARAPCFPNPRIGAPAPTSSFSSA